MKKQYIIDGTGGKLGIRTGEFRRPLKGEYFLSGAKDRAYLAYMELSMEYWIVKVL